MRRSGRGGTVPRGRVTPDERGGVKGLIEISPVCNVKKRKPRATSIPVEPKIAEVVVVVKSET